MKELDKQNVVIHKQKHTHTHILAQAIWHVGTTCNVCTLYLKNLQPWTRYIENCKPRYWVDRGSACYWTANHWEETRRRLETFEVWGCRTIQKKSARLRKVRRSNDDDPLKRNRKRIDIRKVISERDMEKEDPGKKKILTTRRNRRTPRKRYWCTKKVRDYAESNLKELH